MGPLTCTAVLAAYMANYATRIVHVDICRSVYMKDGIFHDTVQSFICKTNKSSGGLELQPFNLGNEM